MRHRFTALPDEQAPSHRECPIARTLDINCA
jgi:hypothetical protein